MCVHVRSRNQRSCEITTAQPGKFSRAFSSEPRVSTSRSFVGSSSRIRLPPCLSVNARLSLLRSPPDSTPAGFCWSGPLNPNADT
ncbi:Uncharacterised protein [Mycobacterium tuberculosis]|nr:Uncharacterised protein [Mycobacterium tuberculosis]